MKYFIVNRYELHISRVRVKATDPTDATTRVLDGEGEEISCEYHSTPDEYVGEWTVEKE